MTTKGAGNEGNHNHDWDHNDNDIRSGNMIEDLISAPEQGPRVGIKTISFPSEWVIMIDCETVPPSIEESDLF